MVIIIIIFLFMLIFLYSCLRISSECSREEERRDLYKVIRIDIERKKDK